MGFGRKVLLLSLFWEAFVAVNAYPLHASCSLEWHFETLPCDTVQTKLVEQIKKWSGLAGCKAGGEKCLYNVTSNTANEMTATHTTPKRHYVDLMSFKFLPATESYWPDTVWFEKYPQSTGCSVKGNSHSSVWYAILDFGTNYCNLHNLLTGSALDKTTGFEEVVSDHTCTQYTSADCSIY